MIAVLTRLLREEEATTAIEYAMIAGGIALAIIATVNALGQSVLTSKFNAVKDAVK